MDQLGPNPSIEAVQDEREFYQILLDTLDPEAADYASERASHERKIRHMEAYLVSKRAQASTRPPQPATPSSSSSTSSDISRSGASITLPSRERQHMPINTHHAALSPPTHHAVNGNRKRPRENSLRTSDNTMHSSKSRRTSANTSVSDSSASTPSTVDSLDDASAAYEKEAARQRMLAQQRLQEERFRIQREDAALARRLASELSDSPSSTSSGTRPSSQSYFGHDGRIHRRQATPPSQPQPDARPGALPGLSVQGFGTMNPASFNQMSGSAAYNAPVFGGPTALSQVQHHGASRAHPPTPPSIYGHASHVPGNARRDASYNLNRPTASIHTNPAANHHTNHHARLGGPPLQILHRHPWMQPQATTMDSLAATTGDSSSRPSDSDLEFISSEQFRAASVGRTQQSPSRMPGAFPGSASVQAQPPTPSQLAYSYPSMRPGQSMYNSMGPPRLGHSRPGPSQPGPSRSGRDWMASLMEFGQNFGSTLASIHRPIMVSSDSEDDDEDQYRRTMLRERGLDYLYSDPTKTKEELDNLLNNIRPDEDLPPELRQNTPFAMSRPLMAHQKLGLTWLKQQEEGSNKGCILADDMGLGKTIQALALMLVRPSEDPAVKTTLIVAPVALLKQWKDEIDDKVKPGHKLRTFVFHGPLRVTYAQLASYDVVITTLGKLGAELKRSIEWDLRKKNNPSLVRQKKDELVLLGDHCKWYRVIVDEAQSIKNKSTRGSQAACRLQAKHRLCMTGTPMMNNVGELYSLLHFLRIPPYNSFENFSRDIGRPIAKGDERSRERGMRALQVLLKAVLLRRTKKSTIKGDDGVERPILTLPERITEIKHAVFDEEQQEFYDALEKKTAMKANRFLQGGHIGRDYANILVLLLRLRQACDHPHLIKDLDVPEGTQLRESDMTDLAKQLPDGAVSMIKAAGGAFECPICMDATENPTIFFPCGHDVCSECFTKLTDPSQAIAEGTDSFQAKCPECRAPIKADKILTYNFFKKVHVPDEYVDDMLGGPDKEDSETESDESSDDESDAGSQGDLRDFIVDDDVTADEAEDSDLDDDEVKTEPRTKDDEAEEDDDDADFSLGKRSKGKGVASTKSTSNGKPWTKSKSKSKGKKPSKKPKMTMAQLKKESRRNAKAKRKYLRRLEKNYESSAKIDKTMEILSEIETNSPHEKTIIFSQFTSFLDLLEVPVMRAQLGYKRYDGSMSAKERELAIDEFKTNPHVKVMLISLKAGNAGLNLTRASQVIILDPFWNPFIEDQAIDRAHRIGQQREVRVHRILCEKTVEDRIVALQEKKRELISEALDEKAAQSLSRLGVNELRYLFGLGGNPN